jgi:hypothetical protein
MSGGGVLMSLNKLGGENMKEKRHGENVRKGGYVGSNNVMA